MILNTAKSLTQINLSVNENTSHHSIKEEFQEEMLKKQIEIKNTSQFENLCNQIKSENKQRQKKLNILEQQIIRNNDSKLEYRQLRDDKQEDDLEFERQQEMQQSMNVVIANIKHSIDQCKIECGPLRQQVTQLGLQEKQAIKELRIAESEFQKVHALNQDLKQQIEKIKEERKNYLTYVLEQRSQITVKMEDTVKSYEQRLSEIEISKQMIEEQKRQLQDLDKEEQQKWEAITNQQITLLNFKAVQKVYQLINQEIQDLNISEEDLIPNEVSELESESDQENLFSTEIKVVKRFKPKPKKQIKPLKFNDKEIKILNSIKVQDTDINLMFERVLQELTKLKQIQKSLFERNMFLEELKDELIEKDKDLSHQISFYEQNRSSERQIFVARPQIQIVRQQEQVNNLHDFIFSIITKTNSLMRRIFAVLNFLKRKSDKFNQNLSDIIDNSMQVIGLMRRDSTAIQSYPKLKATIQFNNLLRAYCSTYFDQFAKKVDSFDDDILADNLHILSDIIVQEIGQEFFFKLETFQTIYNLLAKTLIFNQPFQRSISKRFPTQVQLQYNAAAVKIQEYNDSKISDIQSKRRNNKKSFFQPDYQWDNVMENINNNPSPKSDDGIEDIYLQVKQAQMTAPRKETLNESQSKTTLLYDGSTKTTMQEIIRQNKLFSQQIKKIQSETLFSDMRHTNFKSQLDQEKKNLERMNQSKTFQSQLFKTTRPYSQQKQMELVPIKTTQSFKRQSSMQSMRPARAYQHDVLKRDMANLRNQMQRIQKLKYE
ncbi:hypothetical protein pb186bvf_014335 [Paramecium bursaria]